MQWSREREKIEMRNIKFRKGCVTKKGNFRQRLAFIFKTNIFVVYYGELNVEICQF